MILNIIQIIISALLIAVILLQQKSSGGLGSAFGGGGDGAGYKTKRGFEKKLFISSVVLATLFICIAFLRLLIK